jgi:WD repeat-containing protein mio
MPSIQQNIKGVSLSDRLAFACMYLSDSKLSDYVKTTIILCTDEGDLNGLLLTGATHDGIQLLQSYLDETVDVQTVSLIATRIFSNDLLTDLRVQSWISSYRALLDVWGLWVQRANFDITMGNVRTPPRAPRSVFLLCSFCGKSVSSCYYEDARMRPNTTHMGNKLSSCPNCRKPLPRCSLCLLHMGVASQHQAGLGNSGWQSKPFSKWFSWCQSCRHGGHTEHLAQWFR